MALFGEPKCGRQVTLSPVNVSIQYQVTLLGESFLTGILDHSHPWLYNSSSVMLLLKFTWLAIHLAINLTNHIKWNLECISYEGKQSRSKDTENLVVLAAVSGTSGFFLLLTNGQLNGFRHTTRFTIFLALFIMHLSFFQFVFLQLVSPLPLGLRWGGGAKFPHRNRKDFGGWYVHALN